jgi:hypothetical protein
MMYENLSSRSVFASGPWKHKKIQQLNRLVLDYGMDLMSDCETRTDWWFVTEEESTFNNPFENG